MSSAGVRLDLSCLLAFTSPSVMSDKICATTWSYRILAVALVTAFACAGWYYTNIAVDPPITATLIPDYTTLALGHGLNIDAWLHFGNP
jgi:hypothetical protein